jgi:hypothetical protein
MTQKECNIRIKKYIINKIIKELRYFVKNEDIKAEEMIYEVGIFKPNVKLEIKAKFIGKTKQKINKARKKYYG